jgi:amino acid adenylation domain-containing protein
MALLHQRLLDHARTSPERLAVMTAQRRYTYRELSAAVAAYITVLRLAGLRRGDRLVALLDPGFESVVLLCACANAGVVFVPMSPENPATRIAAVVAAATPAAIVTAAGAEVPGGEALPAPIRGTVAGAELRWSGEPAGDGDGDEALEIDPAYIVFTSGSTGAPKGIVMSHRAATAFIDAMVEFTALLPGSVVGSIAPIQFDFWLLDVSLALASGGTIAFIPRHSFFQPRQMLQHMRAFGVTQMNGVPSLFLSLLRHVGEGLRQLTTLRAILFAGEAFPIPHLQELMALLPGLRVINCFGQSESIACAFADVPNPIPAGVERLSFGRGHAGVELLNIDEHGRQITSPGVIGELYLRAPNLFSGYWADAEATARALVPHPLAPQTGERVFKTGDLVYLDERGDYYFVSRADDQVKVMGNRVELGEIAAILCRMPEVANAVAVARTAPAGDAGTSIVAYVVPQPDCAVTAERLRAYCLQSLPRHMLPSAIELKGALPLNDNGKIDVRRIKNEWLTA